MNLYEQEARERKARQLESVLDKRLTAERLEVYTAAERTATASLAGVKYPSDDTWALVVEYRRARARVEAAMPADPFAGLTREDVDGPYLREG